MLCLSCNEVFADYTELALHIQSSKKGHRKGKKWASNYLLRTRQLDQKQINGRVPLTEEQKENKRNMVRELSGRNENVVTYCPQCKSKTAQPLPVEFTQSREAWRIGKNFAVLCSECK